MALPWTDSMSTSEYRAVDGESDLPISSVELAALASQLYATSLRPGPDSPPQSVPVAPRGSVPDTTAATSAGQAAAGSADLYSAPVPVIGLSDIYVPAPTSPEPEPPPQTVPVAPRGNVPDTTAAPSAAATTGSIADPYRPPVDLSAFAVPTEGIVPTLPGVLAGGVPTVPVAPRGSAPSWPHQAPSVPALGWSDAVPGVPDAPAGDEHNYYFLTAADPVPQLPDEHEVFDVNAVRADFPILKETVNGKPLIWFDNAATTQKPQVVIDRLSHFYAHENSNIHRAAHELAARATDAYEAAREKVRRFINAPTVKEIIFVRGTTEGINLVGQSWGRQHLQKDDEIVITWLEHHANIVPWQMLCAEKGAKLRVAPVDNTGQVLLDEYQKLLNQKTRLVAFAQVSNALGTVTPAQQMIEMAHRYGAKVLLDGAQAVSHMQTDVPSFDCEFYVFSGHKMFAPTGIGVVFGKLDILENTQPWHGGGNMIQDVTFEKTTYQPAPGRFEAGTGNIADAVGLGAAIDYLERVGMVNISHYEHDLLLYATEKLQRIPGLRLIGTAREKAGVLSFVLDGFRTEDVGAALNRQGIAVRAGHHCAQPILRRFGVESTVRPSLAFYNTCEEIDALVAALWNLKQGHNPL